MAVACVRRRTWNVSVTPLTVRLSISTQHARSNEAGGVLAQSALLSRADSARQYLARWRENEKTEPMSRIADALNRASPGGQPPTEVAEAAVRPDPVGGDPAGPDHALQGDPWGIAASARQAHRNLEEDALSEMAADVSANAAGVFADRLLAEHDHDVWNAQLRDDIERLRRTLGKTR